MGPCLQGVSEALEQSSIFDEIGCGSGIGGGVKLLVLRAEGRRFESGGRFFGGFELVFEVIEIVG